MMHNKSNVRKIAFTLFWILFIFISLNTPAQKNESYISTERGKGTFTLSESPLYISSKDYPGVLRVVRDLQNDIYKVTNSKPDLLTDSTPSSPEGMDFQKEIVIVGTLGKNILIDKLVAEKKLDVEDVKGKWETFLIEVVEKPFIGVDRALVIVGSDKRGTIYGVYDFSEKIGVSPWYWWADVPVKKKDNVYVLPGRYTMGEPKVKYRGIFINDEAPALSGWSMEKFGTDMFNHELYEHVFELILRLKGNFLWPAMWGRAFYDDDSLNPKLADEYGVVISTSHHEPMMRAHVEWQRYGSGPWNYEKNENALKDFWRKGIERMNGYESVITLAMRGDGDEAMSPDANVELLEKIVKDQREIIKDVMKKEIEDVPQVWALYKEVQEYYDKGMRVPDDVTILLCDDNWGNIRKLPKLNVEQSEIPPRGEKPRKGGYGIYYHFDYVGGPRNYKWLNTNQIERVWEQMHLAYEYGADRIWIVNVGDIKPMEFPIDFFLDYAWNPEKYPAESLFEYYRSWAEEQFGKEYSDEIADIISKYTKYNSRRKPELLSPETYSLINYREAETVVLDYNQLLEKANKIYESIPEEYKDAFYQLVLHPVEASANLNELYFTAAKNRLYAEQERATTNILAEKVKDLFKRDAGMSDYYNNVLAGGKWKHMMDQTHIGYTNWQQPDKNNMPEVVGIETLTKTKMGVAIEGSEKWFPGENSELALPEFDKFNKQSYYIEIFNQGQTSFYYSVRAVEPWVKVNKSEGKIEKEERLWISVDWDKAPEGKHNVSVTISGSEGSNIAIQTIINNPSSPETKNKNCFVEGNGYISIEAIHFTNAVETNGITWQTIPNLGRTLSAVTPVPVTSPEQAPGDNSPHLEYQVYLFSEGEVTVNAYLSPTLNFHKSPEGIRYAVSFDDETPQIINIITNPDPPDLHRDPVWSKWVAENINMQTSKHNIDKPGEHTLKFWMVDPGVVLQKLVIETGNIAPSYLGPPESFNRVTKTDKAGLE
ncbi:MAG: glycosyl hydrolase [Ignavibacteria bacterium GWA2_35_9]|nr:MAG: glycosyl hydrolase [Ignavibacteria bacterium GWA2_35_9]OGU52982.1 MAG: glycosyl hydrolase [Ignavibacteria bacterium GWC2_36_12]